VGKRKRGVRKGGLLKTFLEQCQVNNSKKSASGRLQRESWVGDKKKNKWRGKKKRRRTKEEGKNGSRGRFGKAKRGKKGPKANLKRNKGTEK